MSTLSQTLVLSPRLRAIKVLLAEDNRINRKVLLVMMKKLGIACDAAADGAIAVEMARTHVYDMIFMDCNMPVMVLCRFRAFFCSCIFI